MRALVFVPYPTPYRVPLWEALARRGDLTVWCYATGSRSHPWSIEYPRDLDVRIARTSSMLVPGQSEPVRFAHRVGEMFAGERPDAVFISNWNEPASWQIRREALKRSIPIIALYESTLLSHTSDSRLVWALRRRYLAAFDLVIVPSELAAEAVRRDGVPDRRIIVSDNVVDVEYFRRPSDLPDRPSPGHRFVCVAQLVPRKNHDVLLRAFADIRDEGDELWLIGDGPHRREVEGLVAELELGGSVSLWGHLAPSEVRRALWQAQTGMLVSTRDVWGMVVNEMLAAGLHVVVSDRCGVAPTVAGDPGVFVCSPDREGIGAALRESRFRWTGPIEDPPMLQRTPERAAASFVEALHRVT